jgi:hypothetical protein
MSIRNTRVLRLHINTSRKRPAKVRGEHTNYKGKGVNRECRLGYMHAGRVSGIDDEHASCDWIMQPRGRRWMCDDNSTHPA